jgi:hypothetical protein
MGTPLLGPYLALVVLPLPFFETWLRNRPPTWDRLMAGGVFVWVLTCLGLVVAYLQHVYVAALYQRRDFEVALAAVRRAFNMLGRDDDAFYLGVAGRPRRT